MLARAQWILSAIVVGLRRRYVSSVGTCDAQETCFSERRVPILERVWEVIARCVGVFTSVRKRPRLEL